MKLLHPQQTYNKATRGSRSKTQFFSLSFCGYVAIIQCNALNTGSGFSAKGSVKTSIDLNGNRNGH